jgi:penicillin-binding protein 2
VFFYQVGQRLGVDRLAWYAKAFGLGAPTGIELDQESAGLVPTARWKKRFKGIPWQGGETLSVAIGQGYNLATPLQMAVVISAIANGGKRYKPIILKLIETADDRVIQQSESELMGHLPMQSSTLEIIKESLWQVVNAPSGTAKRYNSKKWSISGKTGTAQVFSRKDDESNDDELAAHLKAHAWFVAYAPSENPQIAIAVFVEHGEHGSSTGAPIAKQLIETYLDGLSHNN